MTLSQKISLAWSISLPVIKMSQPPPRAESGWHLYCTVQRLVLLSHLNTAKLFNDYILFQEYTPVWALKQVFFFFQTFCYIIIPISGIMGHYSMMVNYNKNQKKNKLRTIYSKNHENFKSSKPRLQFYWFL